VLGNLRDGTLVKTVNNNQPGSSYTTHSSCIVVFVCSFV
jgi:hypothetical protein